MKQEGKESCEGERGECEIGWERKLRGRESETVGEIERETESQRERERQTDRQTDRERERGCIPCKYY